MANNDDFKFTIVDNIGVLGESKKGFQLELNLVSWNGEDPKYDLRKWNEDHTKMGKGVTLTLKEIQNLKNIIKDM